VGVNHEQIRIGKKNAKEINGKEKKMGKDGNKTELIISYFTYGAPNFGL